MTKIIALSGRKGAGKNTVAGFIADFFPYHVAQYSFADWLKKFCIDVLGLEYSQCYGSDDEKETPTKYNWANTPDVFHKGFMTGREVMQIFGTDCVRSWFGNVWAEATLRRIKKDKPNLAIIADNRFPSEVEIVLNDPNGHIIRLTRSPFGTEDMHSSEASLDDFDWNRDKCYVLDNANMSKVEQNTAIRPILNEIFSGRSEK